MQHNYFGHMQLIGFEITWKCFYLRSYQMRVQAQHPHDDLVTCSGVGVLPCRISIPGVTTVARRFPPLTTTWQLSAWPASLAVDSL